MEIQNGLVFCNDRALGREGEGREEEEKEKAWLPDVTHPWRNLESRLGYTIVNQGLRIT